VVEPVTKLPTRSPTHEDIEMRRLASMGLELEEIAADDTVELGALIELAEDRGRPASHYVAAIPLASEFKLDAGNAAVVARVCAGTCQRYGALDLIDHMIERWQAGKTFAIAPVSCLDRCDQAPACELHGPHGQLVLAPASKANVDEALAELAK
jgi:NADH:ubiquinone oxidoreductase subunit E